MLRRSSVTWWKEPFFALDTESTGLNFANDRVIQLGITSFSDGEALDTFEYLYNTPVNSAPDAVATHGITDEYRYKVGVDPIDSLLYLRAFCSYGQTIVIMNAPFDLNFLIAEWLRIPIAPPEFKAIFDPLVVSRFYEKNRIHAFAKGQRTLKALSERYGIRDYPLHSAGHDSRRVGELAIEMARRHGQIGRASIIDLHKRQTRWHRQWCDNFGAFADAKGFEFNRTEWPHNPWQVDIQEEIQFEQTTTPSISEIPIPTTAPDQNYN